MPTSPDRTAAVRDRILLVALEGWNDAGEAASRAVARVGRMRGATTTLHRIDDEIYYDYSAQRPMIVADADGRRRLHWPTVTLRGSTDGAGLFTLTGAEPSLRWRSFGAEVAAAAAAHEVEWILLVGALLTDAPHTREIRVAVGSEDESLLAAGAGVERSTYEGPTGALSVIAECARHGGMRVASLWASVPHYTQTPESNSPKAELALVRRIGEICGFDYTPADLEALELSAAQWEQLISDAVAEDDELSGYVERLEQARDVVDSEEATGDAIAAEFERFLASDDDSPDSEPSDDDSPDDDRESPPDSDKDR